MTEDLVIATIAAVNGSTTATPNVTTVAPIKPTRVNVIGNEFMSVNGAKLAAGCQLGGKSTLVTGLAGVLVSVSAQSKLKPNALKCIAAGIPLAKVNELATTVPIPLGTLGVSVIVIFLLIVIVLLVVNIITAVPLLSTIKFCVPLIVTIDSSFPFRLIFEKSLAANAILPSAGALLPLIVNGT